MTKTSNFKSEDSKIKLFSLYDQHINEWPAPCQKHIIPTTQGTTFSIETGVKTHPKIILLHGSSSNSAMWLGDIKHFTRTHHVFAIDILGECGKSSENRPDFKGNHYSLWLSEVYAALKIDRATLVGCSLGGWIATDFAITYPKKVAKLVLLATAGVSQVKGSTIFWIIITSLFGQWGFNKLNKLVYGSLEIDPLALKFATLINKSFKPRTDVLPLFTNKQLNSIQAQTLFIGGEDDCFYNSRKTSTRLSMNVKQFNGKVLKNTGHVLVNQTANILKFINR